MIVEIDGANIQLHHVKNFVKVFSFEFNYNYVKNYVLDCFRICNVIVYVASVHTRDME